MNALKRNLKKRLQRVVKNAEAGLPQNVVGGIVVGGIDDKPNYLQIRLANRSIVEAFNEFCPPAAGLRVLLEDDRYAPGRWRICAVRNTGRDVAFALTKRHGPNHSWMGGDVTWIYIRQILPLRVSINASNPLGIDVREGWWTNDGQPTWFATQTGIDLSTHRPATGARWMLISISASNVITLTNSVALPSQNLGYSDIPATPAGHYALAVIRLIAGARKIRDSLNNTDLHDLRFSATGALDPATIEHNLLDGLQGGQANEYYHLSQAEYAELRSFANGGTGTHTQVDSHIASINNPHNVTASQVLPNQVGQGGKVLGTDGNNPSWVSVQAIPTLTEDQILALTPSAGLAALGSDTLFLYIADGASWRRMSLKFYPDNSNPDAGFEQNNSLDGYYSDVITNKVIHNSGVGGFNAVPFEGAVRVNILVSPPQYQIYLSGAWRNISVDFSLLTGGLVHYPYSPNDAVYVRNGMSVALDIYGYPEMDEYVRDAGAAQSPRWINGGTF